MHSSSVPAQRWKDCWLHKRALWQEVKGICGFNRPAASLANECLISMHALHSNAFEPHIYPEHNPAPSFKVLPVFSNPLMRHCVKHNATDCWPDSESDSRKCYHTLISYSAKSSQSSNRSQGRQWTQKWQWRDWRLVHNQEKIKKAASFHLALNIDGYSRACYICEPNTRRYKGRPEISSLVDGQEASR